MNRLPTERQIHEAVTQIQIDRAIRQERIRAEAENLAAQFMQRARSAAERLEVKPDDFQHYVSLIIGERQFTDRKLRTLSEPEIGAPREEGRK